LESGVRNRSLEILDAGSIGLIAGIIGLVGAAFGLYAMLWGLGFFDYLGGKRPSAITPISRQELVENILALNDDSKPYRITRDANSDFLAEWKIAEAKWYGIFNKNGLNEAYRAFILLDESRHTARYYEELGSINWTAGLQGVIPSVTYTQTSFHGRILFQKEWAVGYGMKEESHPSWEKVYDYKFDVNEIRDPIASTVKKAGWEWVPVTRKRNVTYASLQASE
jgi:hypothetical protein